jgi:hypothetical protein
MSGPNEPRLMKPRRDDPAPTYSDATGNAGADGYTRIAGRNVRRTEDGMNSVFGYGGPSDQMKPDVGERDYDRGPRFSEDY